MQKRSNHRRTRSTLPDDLNKILSTESNTGAGDRLNLVGGTNSVLISSSGQTTIDPNNYFGKKTSNYYRMPKVLQELAMAPVISEEDITVY